MFTHNILDITWDGAHNATIWDTTGKEYIDMTSGIFSANIGHSNDKVVIAVEKYANALHSYTYNTKIRAEYLEKLCKFTGYEAAALFSAGTEACEAAWKVARQYKGVQGVWGMPDAFHGKTYGSQIMASRVGSVLYSQALEKTCMLILEPYVAWKAQWHSDKNMDLIRGWKNDGRILIVCDEIQAGFGRTGKLFGYEHYDNFVPDLVCIGKGMGNGFPISGLLGPKEIISEPVMDLSSTHGGNPLACAVGSAVIDFMIDNDIVAESARKGEILHKALGDFPVISTGKGMVAALWFESVHQANEVVCKAADKGLLLVHTGKTTVKIGPPLTIPDIQLNQGIAILKEVIQEVME